MIITSSDRGVQKVIQLKNVHIFNKKHDMYLWYAKQKHLGCKRRRGQSEAAVI